MVYLFVDTTKHIVFGLLNDQFEWIEYKKVEDSKASKVLHDFIFQMLEKHHCKIRDIHHAFQVAGPGSYTGMRLSEGLFQILEWQNIQTYSFYHFDVPGLLGVDEGEFRSKAFKGETFIYRWKGEETRTELLKTEKLSTEKNIYSSYAEDEEDYLETSALIFNKSKELFQKVFTAKMKKDVYYYRNIEDEFSKGRGR